MLLDVLGTMLRLESPGPRLRELLAGQGIEVSQDLAAAAFGAEIAYYLEHQLEGHDEPSLARLHDRCAEVLRAELGRPDLDLDTVRDAMLTAVVFTPYEDVVPALRTLREGGVKLVAASNWDVSLHAALARAGLDELLDDAVSSAAVGVVKPDPALFVEALRRAGVGAEHAVHVGDSLAADVEGARAAGIRPVLVARYGPPETEPGCAVITSFAELSSLVLGARR